MIPDRLQYFLNDFWNFQKCKQIWTLGPCIYHQEKYGNILEHHIFISENLDFWKCCKSMYQDVGPLKFEVFRCLETWKFETVGNLKIGNLGTWHFGHLEIWKLRVWDSGSLNWFAFFLLLNYHVCFIKFCEDGDREMMEIG